jgi:hypothetical protein
LTQVLHKVFKNMSEKKSPRNVQFAADTKPNDGVNIQSNVFNRYIKEIFRTTELPPGKKTIPVKLACAYSINGLMVLLSLLEDLIERCKQSPNGKTPVLPHGGGDTIFVDTGCIPHMQANADYLKIVINKVYEYVDQYIKTHTYIQTNTPVNNTPVNNTPSNDTPSNDTDTIGNSET